MCDFLCFEFQILFKTPKESAEMYPRLKRRQQRQLVPFIQLASHFLSSLICLVECV